MRCGIDSPAEQNERTGETSTLPRTRREDVVRVTKNGIQTTRGPAEWFTGNVYIDTLAAPGDGSRISASSVHFTPGARTAWHTHPQGQTIYVTEGLGLAQKRGGPIEAIGPGDRVFFEPGEDHWHGATPDRFMTHTAMLEVDEQGISATWGPHVTDDEYRSAAVTAPPWPAESQSQDSAGSRRRPHSNLASD